MPAPRTPAAAAATRIVRDERGPDAVRLAAAYDCPGRRVTGRDRLRPAPPWAREEAVSTRRPIAVDVLATPEGPPLAPTSGGGADTCPVAPRRCRRDPFSAPFREPAEGPSNFSTNC